MSKNFLLFIVLTSFGFMSQSSFASYWDCTVSIEESGWLFWGYYDEYTREVSADNRSGAEYKAAYTGLYLTKNFFGISSELYVCSKGKTEYQGKTCDYRWSRIKRCSRQ